MSTSALLQKKPLDTTMCFKIFEKVKVISLYWFAAQEQTSTFRQQKFSLFYVKFSAEYNKLTLNVYK